MTMHEAPASVPATMAQLGSANEYLVKIQERIGSLKAHKRQLSSSETEQNKVFLYFIKRAIQIADTCFFASALQTPLLVMSRVLCEDLLMLFWISQSEERANKYRATCSSELTKIARVNITSGRLKIRRKPTGKDVTKRFSPKLYALIVDNEKVAACAESSGLGKLYDVVYRFDSLEVHGRTYGIMGDKEDLRAHLCSVVSLLNAVLFIAENRGRATTAREVLQILGLTTLTES